MLDEPAMKAAYARAVGSTGARPSHPCVSPTQKSRGIRFIDEPRQESYGRVVVFTDKYGNKWDLIEQHEIDDRRLSQ